MSYLRVVIKDDATGTIWVAPRGSGTIDRVEMTGSHVRFHATVGAESWDVSGDVSARELVGTVASSDHSRGPIRLLRTVAGPRDRSIEGVYRSSNGELAAIGAIEISVVLVELATGRFRQLERTGDAEYSAGQSLALPMFPRTGALLFGDGGFTLVEGARRTRFERVPLREETFTARNGEISIAGTLRLPIGKPPFPAVVLVAGSGGFSRNAMALLANVLASRGIAAATFDQRGFGASTGSSSELATFRELGADVAAVLATIRANPSVAASATGLLGHSRGHWIILEAAVAADVPFLISACGPVESPSAQGLRQAIALMRAAKWDERLIRRRLAFLVLDNDVSMRAGEGWEHLSALYEAFKDEAWVYAPAPRDAPARDWMRRNGDHDPLPALRALRMPMLAIYGAKDSVADPEFNAPRMKSIVEESGNAASRVVVIAGANHDFLRAQTGLPSEFPFLRELETRYVDVIVEWIRARLRP